MILELLVLLPVAMLAGGLTGHVIVRLQIRAWEKLRGQWRPLPPSRHFDHVELMDHWKPTPWDPAQGGVHPEEVD